MCLRISVLLLSIASCLLLCTTKVTNAAPAVSQLLANNKTPILNPNDVCLKSAKIRNYKDKYADSSSCHHYYQCFYLNDTVIFGYRRRCPLETYWHSKLLQCLPEGPTACSDNCLNEDVRKKGCYAGNGCRQYFTCSNKVTHASCCPEGTQFNPFKPGCACEISRFCQDSCAIRGLANLTSHSLSSGVNESVCRDATGNTIMAVHSNPSAFKLVAMGGTVTATQYCPPSLYFDLLLCRCNKDLNGGAATRITSQHRKAMVWMPFDTDTHDHSVAPHTVVSHGAVRDPKTSAVTGGGSLTVKKGHLAILNLRTQELRNKLSICFFFRCQSNNHFDNRAHFCDSNAGLLSNKRNTSGSNEFTISLGVQRFNKITGHVNFWTPFGRKQIGASLKTPESKWNQICVTYDSQVLRFYVNGEMLDAQQVGGSLYYSSAPLLIGTDSVMGHFSGHIDDVLITPFDMTLEEITAHFTGNRGHLVNKGFFLLS